MREKQLWISCEKKLSLWSESIDKKVNRVSKIKLKLHMASRRWTWVQQLVRFRRLELYIRLSHNEFSVSQMKIRGNVQARVVHTLDSAIHRINHYLADKCYGNRTIALSTKKGFIQWIALRTFWVPGNWGHFYFSFFFYFSFDSFFLFFFGNYAISYSFETLFMKWSHRFFLSNLHNSIAVLKLRLPWLPAVLKS